MKKLVNWILNRKVVDLDNDGKIELLREELSGVFSQFKTMHDKLESVNGQLDEVIEDEKFAQECERDALERMIEEAEARIAESDNRIGKAELEKQTNNKIKSKVDEFLV